jgi:uncharacterized protein (TIGR03083 family)
MRGARSPQHRAATRELMRAERRDIRALISTLTGEQWSAASLCDGWTVRDLVAHLVGWDDLLLYRTRRQHATAALRFIWLYATSLAGMDRLNRRLQQRARNLTVSDLIERFGADDGDDLKWLFDGTNPGAHLAEYVLHEQDIRRPLALSRSVVQERLVPALDGLAQLPGLRLRMRRELRRARYVATDIDWAKGRGDITAAPGEEILMTLAGRPHARLGPTAATS